MKALYLTLDLGSLLIPLLFTFHPKLKFYKKWRYFIPALLISAAVYLSWDVPFTERGYWGFNGAYLLGWQFLGLPIEEWLFFICIPYACVFMHYTLTTLCPSFRLSKRLTQVITLVLLLGLLSATLLYWGRAYTALNSGLAFSVLLLTLRAKPHILRSFYLTFLVMLVPFFIVNGILTGSGITQEVVWYHPSENLGIRMFTIPVEDTFYALGLILLSITLTEIFQGKFRPNSSSYPCLK